MSLICARTGLEPVRRIHDEIGAPRFSASGICRARMASNFSAVMPGRAPARARAADPPAPTPRRRRRRASRRRSRTAAECRARRRARRRARHRRRNVRSACADQRMHDRFELLQRRGIVRARAARASADRPCRRRSCRERPPRSPATALALVEPVHRGVGVVDRHARPRANSLRRRRLAHADRAGETENSIDVVASFQHRAAPCPRRTCKQRQERQAENGEMVAVDALEQMDAEPFELVGADARRDRGRRPRRDSVR